MRRYPVAEGQIGALEAAAVEGAAQTVLRMGVRRHHHETGGTAVKPMHRMEAGGRSGQLPVRHAAVAHRVVEVTRPGVHGHARGLVHHEQVVILVDDIQLPCGGDRPGPRRAVGGIAHVDRHGLSAVHRLGGQCASPIDRDALRPELGAAHGPAGQVQSAAQHMFDGAAVEHVVHDAGQSSRLHAVHGSTGDCAIMRYMQTWRCPVIAGPQEDGSG